MANPGLLGSATYEVESTWGEDVDTTTTLRIPSIGAIDVSGLVHKKVNPNRTQQTMQGGDGWILGTQEGQFTIKSYLMGRGSTTAGAHAISTYESYLGKVIGNATQVASAGTTLTGGTANIPLTTASGTFAPGALAFVGALGDTDGEGQAYAISTHSGTSLTLLTDLRGAPVNGAVLYSGTMLYPVETATSSAVTGHRFLLQTANLQYLCHGCYPLSYTISGLNPGELPTIDVTWGVSWWEYKASTFPNTTATDSANPAATAAGSLYVNTVGTTTNSAGAACRVYRSFSLECTIGMEVLRGPGGVNAYQDIVGARRTPNQYKVTWTEDADAATTTPVIPGYGTATSSKHILLTCSTADGSRIAMYFPKVCPDVVAIQKMDQNLNRVTFSGMAYSSAVTTSDLTLSAWRMLSA